MFCQRKKVSKNGLSLLRAHELLQVLLLEPLLLEDGLLAVEADLHTLILLRVEQPPQVPADDDDARRDQGRHAQVQNHPVKGDLR